MVVYLIMVNYHNMIEGASNIGYEKIAEKN